MLGLVMALATLYVALEFNTSSGNMSGDASQFDDMQDLDLMPALDRSDMIAAAPSGVPAKPTPKNVKVVDEVKKQLERNATINTLRDAQGEGEGEPTASRPLTMRRPPRPCRPWRWTRMRTP